MAEPEQPPLTEPVIVPCLFITGGAIETSHDLVRFVGWVAIPELGGETAERRIAVRFAMPTDVARGLFSQGSRATRRGGH